MSITHFWNRLRGRQIVIYADFIDPFCYIGFHVLRAFAETKKLELDWRGFELNPGTPIEGLPLTTAENSDLRPGMWASVQGFAQKAGLNLAEPKRVSNTRAAHALLQITQNPAVKNPLIERIYQAYFISQQDIGQVDVLIELASGFGIHADQVRAAAGDTNIAALLETYRKEAQARRFLGLPGFVYRGRNYFGALSRETWEDVLIGGRGGNQSSS